MPPAFAPSMSVEIANRSDVRAHHVVNGASCRHATADCVLLPPGAWFANRSGPLPIVADTIGNISTL